MGLIIRQYNGVIPKSGKSVFPFGAEKFCHRSIKKDKSDYLIRIGDGAILRAYPIGTVREKVIEDLSQNIGKLSQDYELVLDEPLVKVTKKSASEQSIGHIPISMEKYSNGESIVPSNQKVEVRKKSYNLLQSNGEW